MKILQSDVGLSSTHDKQTQLYEKETLEQWNRDEDRPQRLRQGDRLELSEGFQEASLNPKLMNTLLALEYLTGKKIDILSMSKMNPNQDNGEVQRLGWGIDYSYEKREITQESLNFSASGNIVTQDGKRIEFSLLVSMESSNEVYESISLKAGDALIDPLVLNFDNNIISISDIKHEFDLDLDGTSDSFSFVGQGSGFLALDKNEDSKINDGSELFGPNSGNGFQDLKAYDMDNNNWIDENDKVFDKLLIWTKDADGNEELYSLKDKNIGALYLGAIDTSFDLRDASKDLKGQVKESSVYVKEDGEVGTLQEIDLVI